MKANKTTRPSSVQDLAQIFHKKPVEKKEIYIKSKSETEAEKTTRPPPEFLEKFRENCRKAIGEGGK